ncbi:hypothetical protein MMC20_000499 [Loxospora ochrophaea]|nr:hypothetical protein [Loxospora ochrophaea]
MPSPSTPRRASNRRDNSNTPTKPKSVDAGKPLGPYDTNSVRDRVRQWQAQGGGVIDTSDVEVEDNEELSSENPIRLENKDSASRKKSATTLRGTSSSPRKRSGGRKSRVDQEEQERNRSGSAPRKRVISDGHWRKNRSPPKSATSSSAARQSTPTKILSDDGIRVKPSSGSRSGTKLGAEHTDTSRKPKSEPREGARTKKTTPESRRRSQYLQPPNRAESGSRSGDNSDEERPSSRTTPSPPPKSDLATRPDTKKPQKINSSTRNGEPGRQEASRRQEASLSELPQDTSTESKESTKNHKTNLLSHVFDESKKIFSKPETVPLTTPRIPSIEAWLSETPDPFVDAGEPPIEIPLPLKSTSRRKKEAAQVAKPEDPNKIWEALDSQDGSHRSSSGRRQRRRVRSSALQEDNPFPEDINTHLENPLKEGVSATKMVDLVQEVPELSPPSLRRRGARKDPSSPIHERRKSSPLKESFSQSEVASVVSTADTVSSVEFSNPNIPLRPPGLNIKRPAPQTGRHRLSTIASVETFNTRVQNAVPPSVSDISELTVEPHQNRDDVESEARDQFDPNSLYRSSSKNRLTKHSDLISVLSLPKAGNKSIQSARSIRTNRSRLSTATIEDLMKELDTDESKYMRELRTLVDGVIPVLLTCVLSRSDSAIAAGLFRPSASSSNDPNFTRPIVDMGIAVERLRTLHKRIPRDDPNAFLTWSQGAQRVYSEYLKAWRMGFQDVVVNLAPAVGDGSSMRPQAGADGLEGGLPRNKDGDIVNGDGERVDVAFLLKRPLVRLKYLAKTLKGISILRPSQEAETVAFKYQNLVVDARNRSNEERARLEDEAASSIDPTRARDPRTLAPVSGVIIDSSRRVRARDYFNLTLDHSSGQRVDCRVELLLRDDSPERGSGGDVLICEVDSSGRWLLLPPVQFGRVSARNGDTKGEIVVMLRGLHSHGAEWHELLSLQNDDEQVGFEWVQMLGLQPIPPVITRSQSFVSKQERRKTASVPTTSKLEPPLSEVTPGKSRTPSPREIEIPIGEPSQGVSETWKEPPVKDGLFTSRVVSSTSAGARLQKKPKESPPTTPIRTPSSQQPESNDLESLPSQKSHSHNKSAGSTPTRSLNEILGLAGSSSPHGLRRTRAKRVSRYADASPGSPKSPKDSHYHEDLEGHLTEIKASPTVTTASADYPKLYSPKPATNQNPNDPETSPGAGIGQGRPSYHRSKSLVPSMELPVIPKVRKDSPPTTPEDEAVEEFEWPAPVAQRESAASTPSKLTKKRPEKLSPKSVVPPPAPAHRSPSPVQLQGTQTPTLSSTAALENRRRSSSPLKHEYEPSTASESLSDSDASTVERNEVESVSDSSEEDELEDEDAPTPLLPLGALHRYPKVSPQGSIYSLPNGTLTPSQSASQAPYKTVPPQPNKAAKTIATIFFWSDTGTWQNLHPDECSIAVTPGLIEAFEMSAFHSRSEHRSTSRAEPSSVSELSSSVTSQNETSDERPLVALELTPLVPIRRGTALDISIRSPPTANSKITSGSNIMFRSRNPEECESLYALINYSRINNPTYIALQNARGPYSTSSFPAFDRTNSNSRGSRNSSWLGFGLGRKNSYRASSAPTPSIAPTESSIGSMTSAFSALKRFGKGGSMFNISRSTISSRTGSRANSVYTSSDNSSGSGTSSPLPIPLDESGKAAPIGLSNAKIRLYTRETASKWRDMGSARLTIMRPTNAAHPPTLPPSPRQTMNQKRILISGKTKGETLLDVTLGESRFERVARTGIALSVWEDFEGGMVGAVGGVGPGRARVYMIQMKSEAETAYTFSIVGKLRY